MNIVIITGSPRRKGNTETLAAAFVKGAENAGHTVDIIRAAKLNIHGCINCDSCYRDTSHKCVFDDDMTGCYNRLAAADVIVIATPVYFYSVSSQLKALIDRLHNPVRGSFRVKKLALLAVCADEDDSVFDSLKAMYKSTLDYFGLEDGGTVCVSGVSYAGAITGSKALGDAELLGNRL